MEASRQINSNIEVLPIASSEIEKVIKYMELLLQEYFKTQTIKNYKV